jgi:hypothetical protein
MFSIYARNGRKEVPTHGSGGAEDRGLDRPERPQIGDPISVTDDDGSKVRAIIVGSLRYDPPLGRYTVDADEV